MKRNALFIDEYAVSELVGTMFLVLVAIVVFSAIYMYVFPLPFPPSEPNVQLRGYVTDDGIIVIEHIGGESLTHYRTNVRDVDGTPISTATYQNREDPWEIGGRDPLKDVYAAVHLPTENHMVHITIYNIDKDGNEQPVFDGILTGKGGGTPPVTPLVLPMLISSLRTNTTDEDLICFNYSIDPDVNALTYIYNWVVDAQPFAEIVMPFDTESTTFTRDYSGNGYNGMVDDAKWTNSGVVGGNYYFDGSNDNIEMSLPSVFDDISNNDFTISLWLKSVDIEDQWTRAMEARKNNRNFVQFFQYDSEIHFAVCENRIRRVVRTDTLSSDTWYHIVGVWDASEKSLAVYTNGVKSTEVGNRNYGYGSHEALDLGQRTGGSRNWEGYIDEFQLYDHVLSDEQIYQYYLDTKDGFSDKRVIVSEETELGDVWQCIVTPNDGTPIESNILQIVSYGGGGQ